mmetsp:Transcript_18156/g.26217  ORF Transcript_18156/g.26217 Transcript_18156/m.26217 type:complete len:207 (-) Transcript_18156:136-756(-)
MQYWTHNLKKHETHTIGQHSQSIRSEWLLSQKLHVGINQLTYLIGTEGVIVRLTARLQLPRRYNAKNSLRFNAFIVYVHVRFPASNGGSIMDGSIWHTCDVAQLGGNIVLAIRARSEYQLLARAEFRELRHNIIKKWLHRRFFAGSGRRKLVSGIVHFLDPKVTRIRNFSKFSIECWVLHELFLFNHEFHQSGIGNRIFSYTLVWI